MLIRQAELRHFAMLAAPPLIASAAIHCQPHTHISHDGQPGCWFRFLRLATTLRPLFIIAIITPHAAAFYERHYDSYYAIICTAFWFSFQLPLMTLQAFIFIILYCHIIFSLFRYYYCVYIALPLAIDIIIAIDSYYYIRHITLHYCIEILSTL
jgi:hypothetical protein